jgi:chaperonin GroES
LLSKFIKVNILKEDLMNISSIKPLHDFVLVEPVEQETVLPSGIVLPDTAKEKPQKGKILATGEGKIDSQGNKRNLLVKVGDMVLYKKWGGTELKIENKNLLMLKEEDIIAVINE